MKKIKYFLLAVMASGSFLFTGCDDEDGFYNEKNMTAQDLVAIQTAPSYSVGDYLYVSGDFSRYLPETGQTSLLDIYQTTSAAPSFVFSYLLEKQTAPDVWQAVEIPTSALDIDKGSAESGFFVLAKAVYNAANERYEYLGGLPLQSAGTYRLSFGINSDATAVVELRSNTVGNNLFLNIDSSISQLNNQGFYIFTVN